MKKGPNLRWSLIQYSGGDEGDRTPDLLTASQALSQLSYAPVRKSTIRELGRRCKDNFGKTFRGGAPESRGAVTAATGRRYGRAPRGRAALPPPAFQAPSWGPEVRRPPLFALGARPAMRPAAIPPAAVPLLGPIAPPPSRPFQNHAGLRGWAGNPRACRN